MLVIISAANFPPPSRHRLDPAHLPILSARSRRQNGLMQGRNSREKASQMWWQKLETILDCLRAFSDGVAGGWHIPLAQNGS